MSHFTFYRVLCLFKLGVVFLQLHSRYRSGATLDARFGDLDGLGHGILGFTHAVMRGRAE